MNSQGGGRFAGASMYYFELGFAGTWNMAGTVDHFLVQKVAYRTAFWGKLGPHGRDPAHSTTTSGFFNSARDGRNYIHGGIGTIIQVAVDVDTIVGRSNLVGPEDNSVSRRQAIICAQLDCEAVTNTEEPATSGVKLKVVSIGRNPTCALRTAAGLSGSSPIVELKILRQGESYWLCPGDSISLSLRSPNFYKLSACPSIKRKKQPDGDRAPVRSSTTGIEAKRNQESQDDPVAKHEKKKKYSFKDAEVPESRSQLHHNTESADRINYEVGGSVATSVAGQGADSASCDFRRSDEQSDPMPDDALIVRLLEGVHGLDPVKEFGAVVDGHEFEPYESKLRKLEGQWHWELSHKKEDEEGGEGRKWRNKNVGGEDEDEWQLAQANPHGARKRLHENGEEESKGWEEMDEEKEEEDEDLDGFIVDGATGLDEEDEEDEGGDFGGLKSQGRPDCKYGAQCFRTNPTHLAQFRHPDK